MKTRKIAFVAVVVSSAALLLSACGADEDVSVPQIDATTERQQELANVEPARPSIVVPSVPDEWGENVADQQVADDRDTWQAFTPDEYDYEGEQKRTLIGTWVLREPEGDRRNDAVFVTLTMRPHGYVYADNDRARWGDDLASATDALSIEASLTDTDVAQSEDMQVGGLPAHLMSGFAEEGPNRQYNFAYVTVDDGGFFYTYRLAGDPDYFRDFQDEFMGVVVDTEFKR